MVDSARSPWVFVLGRGSGSLERVGVGGRFEDTKCRSRAAPVQELCLCCREVDKDSVFVRWV